MNDTDAPHLTGGLPDDVEALLHRKESPLVLVDADRDDDFIEHRQSSGEDVQVSDRKRIKRSGEKPKNIKSIDEIPQDQIDLKLKK